MFFKHNIETYKKFEPVILKHHECCIVAAMGTGKTDISIEFIKKFTLNTLVILPNVDLCKQWEEIASMNDIHTLSTITYHSFVRNYPVLATGFDCYVFDEAHHMDSKVWGKAIKNFRESLDEKAYIIGLTGDPIRYFDGCKNVVDTIFHGHVIYGHTQYEAIMNGILPNVVYVCAIYDTNGLYKKYYKKSTTERLKGKLNLVYENCRKINDILIYHAPDTMKGFVFVDKIKSITTGVDIISKAFPNETVRFVHSSLPKNEKYNNINAFREDNTGFMVAVDMFNEGHHVSGVNTIIMLRKTGSPTIYAQQIGRGLSANYNGTTIIYDFVGNKESMKSINERISIITNMIGAELNKKSNKKSSTEKEIHKTSKQIIIHDYTKDFLEVIEEIDAVNSKEAWTEEEDNILKDNYNTNGVDICVKKLNRSRISCQKRAKRLGLVKPKVDWTEEEDNILKEFYPSMGYAVASKLPGRSERACTARANNYLGITSRVKDEWKSDEIKLLKKQYRIDGDKVKIPNRTNNECICKLMQLGLLKNNKTTNRWTKDEDQILRDNYPILGGKVIDLLPGRTSGSIKTRASILNINVANTTINKDFNRKRWSKEEDQILRDNYPILGGKVIDLLPNRTYRAIIKRAEHIGLKRIKARD